MRFDKIIPADQLKPFVKHFIISENPDQRSYKVFPLTNLVIGFQYKGRLALVNGKQEDSLAHAGITGIADSYKIFSNTAGTGTVLVYFTETGVAHFTNCAVHELFNLSVSLDNLFAKDKIIETEEKLNDSRTDAARIRIVEKFLLSALKDLQADKLIATAVKMIYDSKGNIKIKELNEKLFISQSPFEKRFRKLVGTSPKKFSSIVRFNAVLNNITAAKSLTDLCYAYGFFDQAHFIKDFKQFTGDTPENFKRFL